MRWSLKESKISPLFDPLFASSVFVQGDGGGGGAGSGWIRGCLVLGSSGERSNGRRRGRSRGARVMRRNTRTRGMRSRCWSGGGSGSPWALRRRVTRKRCLRGARWLAAWRVGGEQCWPRGRGSGFRCGAHPVVKATSCVVARSVAYLVEEQDRGTSRGAVQRLNESLR